MDTLLGAGVGLQQLNDARDKLSTARRWSWWVTRRREMTLGEQLVMFISGAAVVGLGSLLFGPVGALGGLLVLYFSGPYVFRQRESISEAEREVQELETAWDDTPTV